MTATALTTTEPTKGGVVALLESETARRSIAPFLPEGVQIERVAAAALMATKKNPALLKCTGQSIVLACATIAQWGLEIGTTAHLVPFGTECTPVADYKGLAELMIASGAVRYVESACVYTGDEFKYNKGLDPQLYHVPEWDPKKRGALKGAYVILHLPFGRFAFEFMPIDAIDAIRRQYSRQWAKGECPPWYARKTVVRQVAKLLPKNPRMAKFLAALKEDTAKEFALDAAPVQPLLNAGLEDDTPGDTLGGELPLDDRRAEPHD